jgi:maltooligosyltrehalose trehalohydrolase
LSEQAAAGNERTATASARRYPVGAELASGGGVHFRVWAPRRQSVEVILNPGHERQQAVAKLHRESSGYHSGMVRKAVAGDLYRFRLDGADSFPDPISRFQPQGPHGPSEVIDPSQFAWTDQAWRGLTLEGQVIYEMHIGTFTREGTFEAARRELAELARVGITAVEVMPVADFPGRFGWGYDGVGLFAPVAIYGRPDDFRRFVDDAHRAGIGVLLDVVYNHIGPDGNYLKQFSEDYFTGRYQCVWGEAINYDGENSGPVREWVASNARYWIEEYHLDGLRLDATQQIFDQSPEHILSALGKEGRAGAGGRSIVIFAENEDEQSILARPLEKGGYGLDGLWNDDFHHAVRVAVTGHREAYYSDYFGKAQEIVSAIKYGYLFQGQQWKPQTRPRGTPAFDLDPARFVIYIENHDQIANSGTGERLQQLTSRGRYKAVTALLLLAPGTPMLFQGQEFGASAPFFFFADHNKELRQIVREGRIQLLSQFRSLAQPEMREYHIDPGDPATFDKCKLDFRERQRHRPIYEMHRDLLRLRREDPVFRMQKRGAVDGAVLSDEILVLRFFGGNGDDRLLLVNLGHDLHFDPAPQPLLAPPENGAWRLLWSSEDPRYRGAGTPPVHSVENWRIPGHAAVVLAPAGNAPAG